MRQFADGNVNFLLLDDFFGDDVVVRRYLHFLLMSTGSVKDETHDGGDLGGVVWVGGGGLCGRCWGGGRRGS